MKNSSTDLEDKNNRAQIDAVGRETCIPERRGRRRCEISIGKLNEEWNIHGDEDSFKVNKISDGRSIFIVCNAIFYFSYLR